MQPLDFIFGAARHAKGVVGTASALVAVWLYVYRPDVVMDYFATSAKPILDAVAKAASG